MNADKNLCLLVFHGFVRENPRFSALVRVPGVGHTVHVGQAVGGIILVAVHHGLLIDHSLFLPLAS